MTTTEWLHDLRYLTDGELRETRVYRGTATEAAVAAQGNGEELTAMGWTE